MSWTIAAFLPTADQARGRRLPLGMPTLGGLQFWADVHLFRDWRIQLNVRSGQHRLLDGSNFQHAVGTYQQCLDALAELRDRLEFQAWRGESVVLLHGLIRTRYCMRPLAVHLESRGYRVYSPGYPSTQISIGSHARNLQRVIESIEGPDPIHLVGFSMGGLIARAYLELGPDPRIHRLVTIGTPNQGADRASSLHRFGLLQPIGPAAIQLVSGPDGIVHQLSSNPTATTGVEVGVIAAGGPYGKGYSFTLPPDNDGVVTVASTLLAGARDFHLVRGFHAVLPSLLTVRNAVTRFLRFGYFRHEGDRREIGSVQWVGQHNRRAVVGWAMPRMQRMQRAS